MIYLSPQGTVFSQARANDFAKLAGVVLLAGRYEGIDERLVELMVDCEVSIGDFVVSGGELPAMLVLDAIIRQLPGALGHEQSAQQDSFAEGLLDCPSLHPP